MKDERVDGWLWPLKVSSRYSNSNFVAKVIHKIEFEFNDFGNIVKWENPFQFNCSHAKRATVAYAPFNYMPMKHPFFPSSNWMKKKMFVQMVCIAMMWSSVGPCQFKLKSESCIGLTHQNAGGKKLRTKMKSIELIKECFVSTAIGWYRREKQYFIGYLFTFYSIVKRFEINSSGSGRFTPLIRTGEHV